MNTLVLRFAGPAQSWASSPFAIKATEGVPTRNAVLGMFAGALGAARGQRPEWLEAVQVMVRVDFHTISAPPADVGVQRSRHRTIASLGKVVKDADFTVPRGDGDRWSVKGSTTMVTERAFLADAEFLVSVTHPDAERLTELSDALREPIFISYLGRKAFAPAFPFHLGVHAKEPMELFSSLPTSSLTGRSLAVHHIKQDKNYAHTHVAPAPAGTTTDLWNGWKTV
jgi:CRISPR system Cascade subunit CasD